MPAHWQDVEWGSLIFLVAYHRQWALVDSLLARGASVDMPDRRGPPAAGFATGYALRLTDRTTGPYALRERVTSSSKWAWRRTSGGVPDGSFWSCHQTSWSCTAECAEVLRRPRDEIAELIVGAFLHDVGKIGIPDAILLKPGALTSDEFAVMKQHVLVQQDLFGGNSWLGKARCIVRHHHERFDGSGYPDGLHAKQIPINARIFAVVDVFDALTSSRPYKPAYPLAHARELMTLGRGSHFDPEVLTTFMEQAEELFTAIGEASSEALVSMLEGVLADYWGSPPKKGPESGPKHIGR